VPVAGHHALVLERHPPPPGGGAVGLGDLLIARKRSDFKAQVVVTSALDVLLAVVLTFSSSRCNEC